MSSVLTADIIAREAVMILENNLVMGDLVYRGYEDEFDKNINGYKIGSTVRIVTSPSTQTYSASARPLTDSKLAAISSARRISSVRAIV